MAAPAQAAENLQTQLMALQRLERMLGIVRPPLFAGPAALSDPEPQVDRIRANVHQMLEDQLPGKAAPATTSRVALTPYVTAVSNDLNMLGREGTELQAYIVAPPPPSAPQSQLALTQMVRTPRAVLPRPLAHRPPTGRLGDAPAAQLQAALPVEARSRRHAREARLRVRAPQMSLRNLRRALVSLRSSWRVSLRASPAARRPRAASLSRRSMRRSAAPLPSSSSRESISPQLSGCRQSWCASYDPCGVLAC